MSATLLLGACSGKSDEASDAAGSGPNADGAGSATNADGAGSATNTDGAGSETNADGGSGAPQDLISEVCERAAAVGCESPTLDECTEGLSLFADDSSEECRAKLVSVLQCLRTAEFLCEDGELSPQGCDAEVEAIDECAGVCESWVTVPNPESGDTSGAVSCGLQCDELSAECEGDAEGLTCRCEDERTFSVQDCDGLSQSVLIEACG